MKNYDQWKNDKLLEEGVAEKLGLITAKTMEWIQKQKEDFNKGLQTPVTEKQAVQNLKDSLNVVQKMQKTILEKYPTLDSIDTPKTRGVSVALYQVEDGLNKIINVLESK